MCRSPWQNQWSRGTEIQNLREPSSPWFLILIFLIRRAKLGAMLEPHRENEEYHLSGEEQTRISNLMQRHATAAYGSRKLIIKKSGARAQNSIFASTLRTCDPHFLSYV
jgi:hypothetical protein